MVMTPEDLAAWQQRMGFNQVQAAEKLGIPYRTYRTYLPVAEGTRRRLPGWLPLMCQYIEWHEK